MLDSNTLSQLKQLKQNLDDAKERAIATVKGTQRRFGFAVLDDGREIFLAPDEMEKVFPGDQVKVAIQEGKDGKPSAQLEKLLESPLSSFTGQYIVKGQGHFVAPDLPQLSRWIFIPPAGRKNAKAGDLIRCRISRHPFNNGKPQAIIERIIGAPDQPGIEADYIIDKFGLPQQWPDNWPASLEEPDLESRADLSELPFVTIDGPETLDMDDALYVEALESGWQLSVAIADPTAFITTGSPLEQVVQDRAASIYLPGNTQSMLPTELANQRCSLIARENRPALVCQIKIKADGTISDYQLQEAKIQVCSRLNYQQVTEALGTDDEGGNSNLAMLQCLKDCCDALLSQRQRDHLLMDDKPDYRLQLDEEGKIAAIQRQDKTIAHRMVEECMVVANRCAADFLGKQGLFIQHAGFREEKLDNVTALSTQQLGGPAELTANLDSYISLIRKAQQNQHALPVKSVFSRWLQRSGFSLTPKAHCGMGLPAYTTFTSPIRKYNDFLVHRLIKAKLNHQQTPEIDQSVLEQLQSRFDNARQARTQMERWLQCQFLQDKKGRQAQGHVVQVNSHGFTVRLADWGIDGFVETKTLEGKYSFDPVQLTLSGKRSVQLDQAINIKIGNVDLEQRKINFEWPEGNEES